MRRCGGIVLGLWVLTGACGSDPVEPVTGALEVTITTTGQDIDPDGYTMAVDANSPMAVPANGSVSIPNLEPGIHTLTLGGLASNCAFTTPAPLEVPVPGEQGAVANVEISCTAIYTLAYQGATGVGLTDAAGTVHRTLVPDADPLSPSMPLAWSPDGRLLAVAKDGGVWIANLEDGGLSQFRPSSGFGGYSVGTWSPDGRELLLESFFVSNSCPTALARYPLDQSYSPQGIYAAPTPRPGCSGFGLRGFTWPGWSPDGTQIVIHEYSFQTYVLSRDGATKRPLAEGGQPDWSPDGSAIVYAAGPLQGATLHLIHPSGSSDRRLTSPAPNEADGCPAWSPDGSKVAFVRLGHAPDGSVTSVHAYVVDRDGTNERQLAVLPGEAVANLPGTTNVVHPAWSADGLHLAYSGYVGTYIVKVDGTGFRQVSEAPAFYPAQWRPRAPRE